MAMVESFYGHQLDMPAMRKRFSANLKGMNLQQLIDVASESLDKAWEGLKAIGSVIHEVVSDEY